MTLLIRNYITIPRETPASGGKNPRESSPDGKSASPVEGIRFAMVPAGVCRDRRLKLTHLRVLICLLGHFDPRNPAKGCWPSQETIATTIGSAIPKVCATLKDLERFGHIEIRKKGRNNYYYPSHKSLADDHGALSGGATVTSRGKCQRLPREVSVVEQLPREVTIEESASCNCDSIDQREPKHLPREVSVVEQLPREVSVVEQLPREVAIDESSSCEPESRGRLADSFESKQLPREVSALRTDHKRREDNTEKKNSKKESRNPEFRSERPEQVDLTLSDEDIDTMAARQRAERAASVRAGPLPTDRPAEPSADFSLTAPPALARKSSSEKKNLRPLAALRFAEFWIGWPKKVAKAAAKKVWATHKLDSEADEIIADVAERLSAHAQWADKQYIPNPDRYLRNRLWEDEIIERGVNGHETDQSAGWDYLSQLEAATARVVAVQQRGEAIEGEFHRDD